MSITSSFRRAAAGAVLALAATATVGTAVACPASAASAANPVTVTSYAPPTPATSTLTGTGAGVITTGSLYDFAELSGITMANGQTLVVNDKTPANDVGKAVLTVPGGIADGAVAQPLEALPNLDVQKLEGITTSPDGRTVFATTAFDRAPGKFSNYNVLLAWPADNPAAATVVGADAGDPRFSLELRAQIAKALPGDPFFKIEGIAATSDQLLLGVREVGKDFKTASYTVKILALGYAVDESGKVQLTSAPRLVWQQDPAQSAELPKTPIGLSDLAFDPNSQSIYLTTSFENAASSTADSVAGYLWRLDLAALGTNAPAELVRNADGSPLTFTHKAEGVLPGPNSITVLHDDDKRVTTVTTGGETRAKLPNEAAFDLVPMR